MKIKKGDTVIITVGKDKGRKGKVERVFPKTQTAIVPGINMYKRHLKKRDEKRPGGIISFPRPLNLAKVMLVCPKCGRPTRVGYFETQGEKERICRKCGQKI